MSYFANYIGSISGPESTAEAVPVELLHEVFGDFDFWEEKRDSTSIWRIDFAASGSYHEDVVYKALNIISPLITEGEIEWRGEDGNFWRHRFDAKTGKWFEEPGAVSYEEGWAI